MFYLDGCERVGFEVWYYLFYILFNDINGFVFVFFNVFLL